MLARVVRLGFDPVLDAFGNSPLQEMNRIRPFRLPIMGSHASG
jgi:hypothetical protein